MKNLLLKALSLISAGIIMSSCVISASAYADVEKVGLCDIIVYADEEYFKSIEAAQGALEALAGDNIEIDDTYSLTLFGFSAKAPEHYVRIIDSAKYFDAHICGYFEELSADEAEYMASSAYASEMIGIPSVHESGYLGSGTVVAVIDNGFDITHEVFSRAPESPSLKKEDVEALIKENALTCSVAEKTDGIFASEKLPYVYNYATKSADVSTLDSHGTHVAAIVGGMSDTFVGVAPECQLLLMKVFDDNTNNASEQYVVSALEDAVALGADVVNLSLGTYSGSAQSGKYSSIERMAKKLTNAGITVVCAAGNDGTTGNTSYYAKNLALAYPLVETPDYGTVNHPAVISDFIAVSSAQNTHITYDTLVHIDKNGETHRIEYTDTNANFGMIKDTFTAHFDKNELEYAEIPGIGSVEDYGSIDVNGKIALIERGSITFIEKVNAAAAAGAVAAVIYDNVSDGEDVYMELSGCTIPAVFISKEDGEYLKNAENKILTFDSALDDFKENSNAYRMSDFSSWGVTPEMALKPDVTSVGESVYSAAVGGTYKSLTGTSMATPFVAGVCALLNEKLDLEESKYILSKRASYVKTAIMNSAHPLINPDTGCEYSPRQQGGGLVDLENALKVEFLITDMHGGASVILERESDDENKYSLEFVIQNLTERELELELDASVLCDEYEAVPIEYNGKASELVFNALTSRKLEKTAVTPEADCGLTNTEKNNVYMLKLAPETECSVKLYITLDDEDIRANDVFENGYYVDGFLYVRTKTYEGSIPFTGFSSNFADIDIFDTTVYEEKLPFFTGNALVAKNESDKFAVLGSYDGTKNDAKEYNSAFSPNADGVFDELYLSVSLLRNISGYKIDIFSQSGELVYTENNSAILLTKGGAEQNDPILIWDGQDGLYDGYIFPDGNYTVEVTAYLNGKKTEQKLTLDFALDTEPPKCEQKSAKNKNGTKTVSLRVRDSHSIRSIRFYNDIGETVEVKWLDNLPEYDETGFDSTLSFDVTGISEAYVWADVTDYAMNTKTVKIRIPK